MDGHRLIYWHDQHVHDVWLPGYALRPAWVLADHLYTNSAPHKGLHAQESVMIFDTTKIVGCRAGEKSA